jgi:drug/metabolite transporter (DMT)-like permease
MSETKRTPSPLPGLIGAFAAIYLIWGSTYAAIKIGIETMPPFTLAGIRFLTAGVTLYLVLRLRGTPRPAALHWLSGLLLGTLMLAGGNGLVTFAERTVPSGIAAVIIATVPLFMTSLEAWPFRRARLTLGAVVGLVLGFVGVAVLVSPGSGELASIDPRGGVILLVASASWSLGSLLSRSVARPANPLMTAALQMTAGGVMLLGWATVAGEWSRFDPAAVSARSAGALLYLITFGSILALGCYLWLMQRTSAAAVSTYAFVNPLVAVLLGWALVGETIDRRGVIATALIVAAVVSLQGSRWIEVRRRLRPRAPRPSPASPPSPPIAAGPEPAAVCCERTAEGGRYRMSR